MRIWAGIGIGIGLLLWAGSAQADPLPCPEDDFACEERRQQLEETLFLYEEGALAVIGEAARACMALDGRAWREAVAGACTGPECIEAAFLDRLSSLDALQPEAGRMVGVELPRTAPLVGILPPENGFDPFEPAPPGPIDLAIEGTLVWAGRSVHHMGLAIESGAEAEHVLVFDMNVGDQPEHDMLLGWLDFAPDTRILARGTAEISPEGVANFDTGQCRYLYRALE